MPKKSDDGKDNKNRNKNKTAKIDKNVRSGTKNTQKSEPEDQIEISKQLLAKRKYALKTPRSKRNNNASQTENAKPMPPLAELEKMFDDSDNENTNPTENEFVAPYKKSIDNSKDELLISPKTVQTIALRLMDKISKISHPSELLCELPPLPVVPPKKRKKPEEHYIVGCKDRPQVMWKPTTKFCKGGDDYGVDRSTPIDDEIPKKRAKRSKIKNVCKSLFNAKTDDIVEMLKDTPGDLSDSSDASTETVAYDYKDIRPPSFSPIPSTSRDNKTIIKNDQLFNESYPCNKINDTTNSIDLENLNDMELANKDVEIVEAPIETIVLDDTFLENKYAQPILKTDCDNSVEIIEPISNTWQGNESPYIVDYSSCLNFDNSYNDVIEVIDVDDVIAENKSIIEKYKQKNLIETVVTVDSNINNTHTMKEIKIDKNAVNPDPVVIDESVQREVVNNAISNIAAEVVLNTAESVNGNPPKNNQIEVLVNYPGNFLPYENNGVLIALDNSRASNAVCNKRNTNSHNKPEQRNRCIQNKSLHMKTVATTPINSTQQNEVKFGDCPICMDSIKGKVIASTLCGHIFCMECIKASVISLGKRCPVCRKKFKGVGFHPIFL